MGRKTPTERVSALLDEEMDNATATTGDLMELPDNDTIPDEDDNRDEEEFTAENAPQPPPKELLYNGKGKSDEGVEMETGWRTMKRARDGTNGTAGNRNGGAGSGERQQHKSHPGRGKPCP